MCISRLCELLVKLDLQAIATAQEPALTVSVSALPRQDQGWSVRDVCKCTQLQTSMISPAAPGHCRCCWSISTALHRGSVGRRHQLAHAACSSCCSISGHLSVQRLRCSKWTTRHKRCKCTVAAHEQDRDVDKEASRKYRRTVVVKLEALPPSCAVPTLLMITVFHRSLPSNAGLHIEVRSDIAGTLYRSLG